MGDVVEDGGCLAEEGGEAVGAAKVEETRRVDGVEVEDGVSGDY